MNLFMRKIIKNYGEFCKILKKVRCTECQLCLNLYEGEVINIKIKIKIDIGTISWS